MKPQWLNKKISLHTCSVMKSSLRQLGVETVCEQALCPNIGECFQKQQATFLILGKQCTRGCKFCNIEEGIPQPLDPQEPQRVAAAVEKLGLKHVVVTSVTRDDLTDGGAVAFSETVAQIRGKTPAVKIELLVPDFKLSQQAISMVVDSCPDIIAHNLETVASLYRLVRQGADYQRSLAVLALIKKLNPAMHTKSGIMLGLGETYEQVIELMSDARNVGCELFSIGQYLAPSIKHYPVQRFVEPQEFQRYKYEGEKLGFVHVESSPYVRSSYMAHRYLPSQG